MGVFVFVPGVSFPSSETLVLQFWHMGWSLWPFAMDFRKQFTKSSTSTLTAGSAIEKALPNNPPFSETCRVRCRYRFCVTEGGCPEARTPSWRLHPFVPPITRSECMLFESHPVFQMSLAMYPALWNPPTIERSRHRVSETRV